MTLFLEIPTIVLIGWIVMRLYVVEKDIRNLKEWLNIPVDILVNQKGEVALREAKRNSEAELSTLKMVNRIE